MLKTNNSRFRLKVRYTQTHTHTHHRMNSIRKAINDVFVPFQFRFQFLLFLLLLLSIFCIQKMKKRKNEEKEEEQAHTNEPSFEFSTRISGKMFSHNLTAKHQIRISFGWKVRRKNDDIIITHDLFDIEKRRKKFYANTTLTKKKKKKKKKLYES